jgi:hypothetical protein
MSCFRWIRDLSWRSPRAHVVLDLRPAASDPSTNAFVARESAIALTTDQARRFAPVTPDARRRCCALGDRGE